MIRVLMTASIKDRPAKIMGVFTARQLLALLSGAVFLIPVWGISAAFLTKVFLSAAVLAPFLFAGWYPPEQTHPAVIVISYMKTLLKGSERMQQERGRSRYVDSP